MDENRRMGLPAEKHYTLNEYVALEAATGIKHVYDNGVVTASPGSTPEHALVGSNIVHTLESRLKDKPCSPFSSDLKVMSGDRIFYPDVSVVCPPVRRAPEIPDAIFNPRIVFEVQTDATAGFDRGEKFEFYRQNEELHQYVLISSTRIYGECFIRTGATTWTITFLGPDSILELPCIDCEIPLSAFYEGMEMLAQSSPVTP